MCHHKQRTRFLPQAFLQRLSISLSLVAVAVAIVHQAQEATAVVVVLAVIETACRANRKADWEY
jgi:hypothetical protein